MAAIAIILAVIDILICVALVLLVVFQEGNAKGLGIIGGGAETFFGKSKGRDIDAKLKRFTGITAITFAILTIILYLMIGHG